MTGQEELKIRPYARLLTMLGEQLIKNEQIALIEILKNAYDADAENVSISFNNFGDSYEILPESEIVITDDGHGMNDTVIREHWLNPATPEKKRRREKNNGRTKRGRVIQGEKGIGRFALFKLGADIKVITRHIDENMELVKEFKIVSVPTLKFFKNGKEVNTSVGMISENRLLELINID